MPGDRRGLGQAHAAAEGTEERGARHEARDYRNSARTPSSPGAGERVTPGRSGPRDHGAGTGPVFVITGTSTRTGRAPCSALPVTSTPRRWDGGRAAVGAAVMSNRYPSAVAARVWAAA